MTELPEKVLVSNGCHDCPFEGKREETWACVMLDDIRIGIYAHNRGRHPDCPLNVNTIKVVKND